MSDWKHIVIDGVKWYEVGPFRQRFAEGIGEPEVDSEFQVTEDEWETKDDCEYRTILKWEPTSTEEKKR